jgi:uncharacterized protein YdhG (YjbR/CyaY superfamily)
MNKAPKDVDEYIVGMPKEVRSTLVKLRHVIKKAAPEAHESISYGMPFYEYGGSGFKGTAHLFCRVQKTYCCIYPSHVCGRITGQA